MPNRAQAAAGIKHDLGQGWQTALGRWWNKLWFSLNLGWIWTQRTVLGSLKLYFDGDAPDKLLPFNAVYFSENPSLWKLCFIASWLYQAATIKPFVKQKGKDSAELYGSCLTSKQKYVSFVKYFPCQSTLSLLRLSACFTSRRQLHTICTLLTTTIKCIVNPRLPKYFHFSFNVKTMVNGL